LHLPTDFCVTLVFDSLPLYDASVSTVQPSGEQRGSLIAAAKLVDRDIRPDPKLVTVAFFELPGLIRSEQPQLHEGIDPDRIECGQIGSESTHTAACATKVTWMTQLKFRQLTNQIV